MLQPRSAFRYATANERHAPRHRPGRAQRLNGERRGLQEVTAVADRVRQKPTDPTGGCSLGRPYPCPPRIQPAIGASCSTVLAQRRQGHTASCSDAHSSRLPSRSRERSAPSTRRLSDSPTDTRGAAQQINVACAALLHGSGKTGLQGHSSPFSAAYSIRSESPSRGSACDAPI